MLGNIIKSFSALAHPSATDFLVGLIALVIVIITCASTEKMTIRVGPWSVPSHTAQTTVCILLVTTELEEVLNRYLKRCSRLAPGSQLLWEAGDRFFEEFSGKFSKAIDFLVKIPPELAQSRSSADEAKATQDAILFVGSSYNLLFDCMNDHRLKPVVSDYGSSRSGQPSADYLLRKAQTAEGVATSVGSVPTNPEPVSSLGATSLSLCLSQRTLVRLKAADLPIREGDFKGGSDPADVF